LAAKLKTNHMFVARVWNDCGFKPHLIRQFKISNDPNFEEKLEDVVGLYLNPPDNAVVFNVLRQLWYDYIIRYSTLVRQKVDKRTYILKNVRVLDEIETKELTVDARVVAIRWDLIPWCLVLDIDVPSSEASDAPYYRGWVIFDGMSEMDWPFHNARLPNGCVLTSELGCWESSEGFNNYVFRGLLPSFSDDGAVQGNPSKEIKIRAKNVIGVLSNKSVKPTDEFLDLHERTSLASDEDLMEVAKNAM